MASISFERAWYAAMELLELRLMTPSGMGLYIAIRQNEERPSAA
jgi:hypothetical protein